MDEHLIADALRDLLAGTTDGAFVVVEDPDTGKFMQFAGSSDEPLVLDLPRQAMTTEEVTRAERLFAESDKVNSEDGSFQIEFGRDASTAAKLALRVFHDVYLINDSSKLRIVDEREDAPAEMEDECGQCGRYGPGRRQWMFYPWYYTLLGKPTGREFICFRCLRWMRIYSIAGMSLLAIIFLGVVIASIWVIRML
jgi:hypothetical protein